MGFLNFIKEFCTDTHLDLLDPIMKDELDPWINVKDKLPNYDTKFLAYHESGEQSIIFYWAMTEGQLFRKKSMGNFSDTVFDSYNLFDFNLQIF